MTRITYANGFSGGSIQCKFWFRNIEFTGIRRTRILAECKTESGSVFVADSQTSTTARGKKRSLRPPYKLWTSVGLLVCRNDNSAGAAPNVTPCAALPLRNPLKLKKKRRAIGSLIQFRGSVFLPFLNIVVRVWLGTSQNEFTIVNYKANQWVVMLFKIKIII